MMTIYAVTALNDLASGFLCRLECYFIFATYPLKSENDNSVDALIWG